METFNDNDNSPQALLSRVADLVAEAQQDDASGRARPAIVEQFVGVIRKNACMSAGAPDYADARYYVDRVAPPGRNSGGPFAGKADAIPGIQQCVTATNIAEAMANTHLLSAGTLVMVMAVDSRTSPAGKWYLFHAAPADAVVVKLTGAASGAGEYNGRVLGGAASATASANLAMPSGMSVAAQDDALVLNVEEDTQSGHRLASGSFASGAVVGLTAETPPRRIVMVRGGFGATASPTALGDGTSGAIAADTGTWSRSTSGVPLDLWLQTRTFWDTGGAVLYAYLRKVSFDARGVLSAVSAETRVVVDTAQSCP